MKPIPWDKLFELAKAARANAYAPYSKFKVGSAVLFDDGAISSGCNVENSSYGLSLCAERSAIASGVREGHQRLLAVAIVADGSAPCPPCGMCRQVMAEFASGDVPVRSRGQQGEELEQTVERLLPFAFSKAYL